MAVYMIFVSGTGSMYPVTSDTPPEAGQEVTPDGTDWVVLIDEVDGENIRGRRLER